jgi:hypothetical protein
VKFRSPVATLPMQKKETSCHERLA